MQERQYEWNPSWCATQYRLTDPTSGSGESLQFGALRDIVSISTMSVPSSEIIRINEVAINLNLFR